MPHVKTRHILATFIALTLMAAGWGSLGLLRSAAQTPAGKGLTIKQDEQAGTISVFRAGQAEPILTQNAKAGCAALSASDRRARRQGRAHRVQPGASQTSDRPLLGLHARQRPRLLSQSGRGLLAARVGDGHARRRQGRTEDVRWQTVYDLLDEAGTPVLTETAALVDARTQRHRSCSIWNGEGRPRPTSRSASTTTAGCSCACRGGRASPARSSTPRGSATSAPKGSARCGSTSGCRSRGATTWRTSRSSITRPTPAIRRPGAWTGSWASAPRDRATRDWTIAKGQTEVVRHQFVDLHGHAQRRRDDQRLERVQRQQVDVRAVVDRAEGRARREVPDAGAGGRADDADRRLQRQRLGRRADGACSRWRSAGTIAAGSGWPRTATTNRATSGFSNAGNSRILILEDTDHDGVADSRKVFMEGIVFPSAIAVGFDGAFIGAPPNLLFVPDRNGDDKADMADIEVRLTGWGIRDRHEIAEQPALGSGRMAVRAAGLCDAFEGQKAGRQGPRSTNTKSRSPRTS